MIRGHFLTTLNVLESGLHLRSHVGADLDEADVGGAARAALFGLVRGSIHIGAHM